MAGAGAGDDVDLAATGSAHVGRVTAGFHLKLLHRIGRSAEVLRAEGGVGVGGAVEKEVVRIGATSADADGRSLTGPPIEGIHVAGGSAVADVSAGDGEHKVNQHAAVQGEGLDGTLIDNLAYACVLGLEKFAGRFDGDSLGLGAKAQLEVESSLLAHLEINVLRSLLKPRAIDCERVGARLQACNFVESRCVRDHFAFCAGFVGFEADTGADDGAVLRIQDGAADDSVVALCAGCDEGDGEAKCYADDSSGHGSPCKEDKVGVLERAHTLCVCRPLARLRESAMLLDSQWVTRLSGVQCGLRGGRQSPAHRWGRNSSF